MQYRSPLANVRGLGSAKSGTHHWWMQRLTALALIPLTLWVIFVLAELPALEYTQAVIMIGSPWVAIPILLFLSVGFYHGAIGLQVVIEDYVADEAQRLVVLLLMYAVMTVQGVVSVFSLLKVAL